MPLWIQGLVFARLWKFESSPGRQEVGYSLKLSVFWNGMVRSSQLTGAGGSQVFDWTWICFRDYAITQIEGAA
jgi:hypothetical protein